MGPIASPEPIHPRNVVSPTSAGFTQVGSVPVNSVWMLGGSVPVNNIEVGYKPIAVNNRFDAITEAHDDDNEEWPALESLGPPQAMKMAKKEAFWMKAQAKEKERKLRSKEDDELMQALIDTQRSNKKVRFCGPNFGPCKDDCCEKPVTGELVKSKLLMSEELVKSELLMSEELVKSKLLMSEKPVKGSGLLMSEKPVTGKLVTSKLVKSGKTYSQAVSGGGSVDEDGFKLVMSKKEKRNNKRVSSLGIRMPEGLKSVEEAPEWEVLEMAVDSGASESVVSDEMLTRVTTVEGDAMKKGVQYEVADGTLIPNLGEKKFIAVSDNGVARQMRAQVCEVNKPLLSVHRVVQAGNRVVFAASGSYVEDEQTGETMELVEKGGVYMLKLWAKAQGFSGQDEHL